jgi:hypothetical protein
MIMGHCASLEKEVVMPALTTREDSHNRLMGMFKNALERIIPLDRTKNMRGATFFDWEKLVGEHMEPVLAAVLEERAQNDFSAHLEPDRLGRCPYCLSEKIYLRKEETQDEILSTHGPLVIASQHCRCRTCDRSFSAQAKEWQLPSEAPLSPRALQRVAREATLQSFDKAAEAINEDWSLKLDGKQIQRWTASVGARCVKERDAEQTNYEAGGEVIPFSNAPTLLVVEVDGGRVQLCEINPETDSRWREDKVAIVTSYIPGDDRHEPQALVTTHVATMQKTEAFGKMARVEAERRGMRNAGETIALGDGGNWIDPLLEREFPGCQRIVDWYHAAEHLYECARAVHGTDQPATTACAEKLKALLNEGKIDAIVAALQKDRQELGAMPEGLARLESAATLDANIGYFSRHKPHMNYPDYKAKGWPIGSGGVEGAVKQFNKRVKGSEQFWLEDGVEGILALRAMRLSEDGRWDRYWAHRPAYLKDRA